MSTVDREFEFPTELSIQPQALIGITGLDTLNNAVHRATWDALCNNRRSERAPVQFKLLSPSHEFLRCKTKVHKIYEQLFYILAFFEKHIRNKLLNNFNYI